MAKQGPLSGQQVANKYRLREPLGSGGMDTVYKAQDTRLNSLVAVKVMSPAGPGASDLQQFTQLFQAEALLLMDRKPENERSIQQVAVEAGREEASFRDMCG